MADKDSPGAAEQPNRGFEGHFQVNAYFYEGERDGQVVREPLSLQYVRSLITEPSADEEVGRGELAAVKVADKTLESNRASFQVPINLSLAASR